MSAREEDGDDGICGNAREHRKGEEDEQDICTEREGEGVNRTRLFARCTSADGGVEVLIALAATDSAKAGATLRAATRRAPPGAAQQRRRGTLKRKRRHRAEAGAEDFTFKVVPRLGAAAIAPWAKAADGARGAARRVAVRELLCTLYIVPSLGVDSWIQESDAVLCVVDASRCGVHKRSEWWRSDGERPEFDAPTVQAVRADRRRYREVLERVE